MDKKALGQRLSTARKAAGFTSDRLSQESDVGAGYIRQIESGRYQPSIATLIKISNTLHRSLDYFLQDSMEWNERALNCNRVIRWTFSFTAAICCFVHTKMWHCPKSCLRHWLMS